MHVLALIRQNLVHSSEQELLLANLTEAANVSKEIVLSVYDLLGYDSSPYKNSHLDAKLDLEVVSQFESRKKC